ncbi:hypothetical protein PL9214720030 [Planktothrix tepida PCC 9214]|uniref:Uncharacterized protein n=1 Tax=Planktothrix tepida PCC 9214 TaxID=671072 RepID=A0A1J1LT32_9CYAN|nr:hypothetical protein PL9214720030 [Planktothrix tepida PCC 9214]
MTHPLLDTKLNNTITKFKVLNNMNKSLIEKIKKPQYPLNS